MTKGIEKTVGLFARKDSRMDSTSSISYGAGVKDLKAKSVAAALERVRDESQKVFQMLKKSSLK